MGTTLQQDNNGILVLNVTGALRKEELDAAQTASLHALNFANGARLLVIIGEDFQGWVGSEVWADTSFFMEHGDKIAKIAIVGDPKWEEKVLMFVGAGLRLAPVKYFDRSQLAQAKVWLS